MVFFGGNVFGTVAKDRIQITENSLQNPGELGGLNNFAEIYIDTPPHHNYEDYERILDLDTAIAKTSYSCNGSKYHREYFASYPDKCMVLHMSCEEVGKINCRINVEIPFIKAFAMIPDDGGGKSGTIDCKSNQIHMYGQMHYYEVLYDGLIKVLHKNGTLESIGDSIFIHDADEVTVLISLATNYELSPHVFMEENPKKKLKKVDLSPRVEAVLEKAVHMGYESLKKRHIRDYQSLFGRTSLILAKEPKDQSTKMLLDRRKKGEPIPYLDSLMFQYGRYLLIASSRKGALPPNLQGVWNIHDQSPWGGSGYWHNINIQMNYWPAFVANLAETFEAYVDMNNAFRPCAQQYASKYIRNNYSDNYDDTEGGCGWTIGTASYPYTISEPGLHSGPGTGGLTSKLYWDYYDYTRDETILREVVHPTLKGGMSQFLTKVVNKYDDHYLTTFSASPEQMLNRHYVTDGLYYLTIGSSFDQQMIEENGRDYIRAAESLGVLDLAYETQKAQIENYRPVEIGWSGQIKEYSEENFYGEVGEYEHRHISQLCGLFPGTLINHTTPAWQEAAKRTLILRSDNTKGWALAHRAAAWARLSEGNRAYTSYNRLMIECIADNLWDFFWSHIR